jgi:hypothetical protein
MTTSPHCDHNFSRLWIEGQHDGTDDVFRVRNYSVPLASAEPIDCVDLLWAGMDMGQ